MLLPKPIQTYFDSISPTDGDAVVAAFAPYASVHDEGRIHRGSDEIRSWWLSAQQKYKHRAEPIELLQMPAKTVVRAKVSGEFQGSPIVLSFTFGLAGNHITELEIGS